VNHKPTTQLRHLLERTNQITVAPGAYDALTARLIEVSGFEAVYMTGAGVSYSSLAKPDIGLLTGTEMATRAAQIARSVDLPVIADGDTGYGNAINVIRTVQEYERAGVAAIQLEDQEMPKKCGHLANKSIISLAEMVGKIEAAVHSRRDPDFVIVARTDAIAVSGLDEALTRAKAYAQAGADVIFVEAPRSLAEMKAINQAVNKPTLANMVEKGQTPLLPATELQELGYKLVIFPGAIIRFLVKNGLEFLANLKEAGSTNSMLDNMYGFEELNNLLGLPKIKELEQKFKGE
jgi:carboxyvinyl-carboxyphosphonate phosphorylmutase